MIDNKLKSESGMSPDNRLLSRYKTVSFPYDPMDSGIVPAREALVA